MKSNLLLPAVAGFHTIHVDHLLDTATDEHHIYDSRILPVAPPGSILKDHNPGHEGPISVRPYSLTSKFDYCYA